MAKDPEDKRMDDVQRKYLGGDGVEPVGMREDPRPMRTPEPKDCPSCGSEYTDPEFAVVDGAPVAHLRCSDCRLLFRADNLEPFRQGFRGEQA